MRSTLSGTGGARAGRPTAASTSPSRPGPRSRAGAAAASTTSRAAITVGNCSSPVGLVLQCALFSSRTVAGGRALRSSRSTSVTNPASRRPAPAHGLDHVRHAGAPRRRTTRRATSPHRSTTIDSGPTGTDRRRARPTFTFSPATGGTFECRVDGARVRHLHVTARDDRDAGQRAAHVRRARRRRRGQPGPDAHAAAVGLHGSAPARPADTTISVRARPRDQTTPRRRSRSRPRSRRRPSQCRLRRSAPTSRPARPPSTTLRSGRRGRTPCRCAPSTWRASRRHAGDAHLHDRHGRAAAPAIDAPADGARVDGGTVTFERDRRGRRTVTVREGDVRSRPRPPARTGRGRSRASATASTCFALRATRRRRQPIEPQPRARIVGRRPAAATRRRPRRRAPRRRRRRPEPDARRRCRTASVVVEPVSGTVLICQAPGVEVHDAVAAGDRSRSARRSTPRKGRSS